MQALHSSSNRETLKVRCLIFALFLITHPEGLAFAQPGWTIEQCIARAKERSLNLAASGNQVRAAQLTQQELMTTRLPQTRLSGRALYAPTWDRFGYDPAITNGGEYAGQLVVQQPVYDGGIRGLRAEQLRVELDEKRVEFRRVERDLIAAVRQGFVEVVRAQREVALQSEGVKQLDEYLGLVHRLAKGGSASSTDVLKTEVQLANTRAALRRAEESAATAMITLKELIGLPSDTAFAVEGTIENLHIGVPDTLAGKETSPPELNLDLAQAEREIARSVMDIELARRETNPIVALSADAGLVTSGDNMRLPAGEREPIVGFSLGMTFELPLFTWGANGLRVEQKQIATENLRLERESLRRSIAAAFQRLRLQLSNARERLQRSRETIVKAEENYLLTKAKFAAGAALSLEVLAAQQLLTDSRLAEMQALADVYVILARIDQLLAQ